MAIAIVLAILLLVVLSIKPDKIDHPFIDLLYKPKSAGKPKKRSIFPYANWERRSKRPRKKRNI
jgi:hypothetical protein